MWFRYVYWGEYPLSFAACLGQEECYRLMLARGADPDDADWRMAWIAMEIRYRETMANLLSVSGLRALGPGTNGTVKVS